MSHHKKPFKPEPPRDKLFLTAGDSSNPTSLKTLGKAVARQPFLSQLDVVIKSNASLDSLPNEILQLITGFSFTHARVNPASLLTPAFMHSYVRTGAPLPLQWLSASGLSVGLAGSLCLVSASSTEDTLAIDGSGHLVLGLSRDTYSTFGWTGVPSRYGAKRDKYVIEVDLTQAYMRDGKPGYERLKKGLNNLGELDLLATFTDQKGSPQAVSFADCATQRILKYSVSRGLVRIAQAFDSSRASVLETEWNARNLQGKRKRGQSGDEHDQETGLLKFMESLACGNPEGLQGSTELTRFTIRGLLHPQLSTKLLEALIRSETLDLVALTGQTMPHSPLDQAVKRTQAKSTAEPTVTAKDQKKRNGSAVGRNERDADTGKLDGWTVLFGEKAALSATATDTTGVGSSQAPQKSTNASKRRFIHVVTGF